MSDETQVEQGAVEVDATLLLTEAMLAVLSSILGLVPLHVDQHNIEHQKLIAQLQHGMNQLGGLAMALGSQHVQPAQPSEGSGGSGIILPR